MKFILCSILMTMNLAQAAAPSKNEIRVKLISETHYAYLFSSTQEYLDHLVQTRFITKEEKQNVERFAKSQKTDLTKKANLPSFNGDTLTWGDVSLTIMPDGSLMTQNGRILGFSDKSSFDVVFARTFKALTENAHTSSLLQRVLINEANAALYDKINNALIAGIEAAGAITYPPLNTLCAATVSNAAWMRYLAEWIKHGDNGKITCTPDHDYHLGLYPKFEDVMGVGAQDFDTWLKPALNDFSKSCIIPSFRLVLGFGSATHWEIPETLSRPAMPEGVSALPCTEEKAARMALYIHDHPESLSQIFQLPNPDAPIPPPGLAPSIR